MKCSRAGTFLTADIRIALLSLGRDAYDKKINHMTIDQKRSYLAQLRIEQRRVGGILKEAA